MDQQFLSEQSSTPADSFQKVDRALVARIKLEKKNPSASLIVRGLGDFTERPYSSDGPAEISIERRDRLGKPSSSLIDR